MTEIWLEWRLTEESVSIQEVCSNLMKEVWLEVESRQTEEPGSKENWIWVSSDPPTNLV